MTTTLNSGPARILASGTATTFFGHPLTIRVDLPEGPWVITLRMSSDPALPDVDVRATPTPDGIHFDLLNFDRADGRGTADPALLGSVGDDLLFLHFRVSRFGRTPDHTLHYTLYRASRADVGWQDPTEP